MKGKQSMWRVPLSVEEAVYRRMQYERLYQAIDRLPKTQRRRLILYYFYDFTYEKIAEIEGCSVHSVYVPALLWSKADRTASG